MDGELIWVIGGIFEPKTQRNHWVIDGVDVLKFTSSTTQLSGLRWVIDGVEEVARELVEFLEEVGEVLRSEPNKPLPRPLRESRLYGELLDAAAGG